jgi:endonuclease/exonuclease/phosphatase family metal-dependent hydrolase
VRPILTAIGCSGEPTQTPEWRLVSYNVWGIPFSKEAARRSKELPAALLALEPDVICLQEVWLAGQREELRAALAGRFQVASASGGGLFLASRFPIVEVAFTPFPVFEGLSVVERLARKGWLDAVLDLPHGRMRVVTTHLALEGPRHLQLGVLLEHLRARRDLPLVLAGDLNTAASDPSWARLPAEGLIDVRPLRRRGDGTIEEGPPTRVGWPRTKAPRGWSPDHVLVRGFRALRFRLALDTPESALSDHNLLLVDLAP